MLLHLLISTLCYVTFTADHINTRSLNTAEKINRIKKLNKKIIEDLKSLEKYDWEEYHRQYEEIEYYNRTISLPFCKSIFFPVKQKKE